MNLPQPSRLRTVIWPLGFLVLVLAAWEGIVRFFNVPEYLLPPPSKICAAFTQQASVLAGHLLVTMLEAVAGFILANILGFLLAVLFSYSRPIEQAIYPYAIALKTTPVLAMAPLLVLWLGTGTASKVVCSALICFFPILVNSTRGLRRVDEEALELFRSLGASETVIFFKLRLPNALPYIFSALRISTSLSVVGAIVGEFVGAQEGIGYLIVVSSYHLETPDMFAGVIMAALGGITFFGLVSLLERLFVSWGDPIESES